MADYWTCLNFRYEPLMVDIVKASLDIRIEDVFILLTRISVDLCHGIMQ
jgi:hypothetical protein